MSRPLEGNLKATILRKLKALRAQDKTLAYRKRHGSIFGLAGDPDVYGLWRGIAWEVELKAPGAQPTALQLERLDEWTRAGALVAVVDNAKDFDLFLAKLRTLIPARVSSPMAER